MSLLILEGLDRVGKTSVAEYYETQGFEVIHMSAPPKGQTADNFLEEMMGIIQSAAHRDIVLDRSYYGEMVWPQIYGRPSLIDEDSIDILREMEQTVTTTHVLMFDPNAEAHWQRCVDNNEPLTKVQFTKARSLYSKMADKYGFERKTLKDFPDAVQPLQKSVVPRTGHNNNETDTTTSTASQTSDLQKTKEQLKLDKANVINEVLSKRIIKGKGNVYDELERNVRHFLNTELGKIFGNASNNALNFSNEEVELLKFFCQRLKDKETS